MSLTIAHVALQYKGGDVESLVEIGPESQTLFIQCPECKKWGGWQAGVPEAFFWYDYRGEVCQIVTTCCGMYAVNLPCEDGVDELDLSKYLSSPGDKELQSTITALFKTTVPKWITDQGVKLDHVDTFVLPLIKVDGFRHQSDGDDAPFTKIDPPVFNIVPCDFDLGAEVDLRLADGRVTWISAD